MNKYLIIQLPENSYFLLYDYHEYSNKLNNCNSEGKAFQLFRFIV